MQLGIRGVSTAEELRAQGMSPGALRHAVTTGRLVRLRRGVYCDGVVWRDSARRPVERHAIEVCAVWLALRRRGWATGYSAALLAGLPVPQGEPRQLCFSSPQWIHERRAYPGVRLRTAGIEREDVVLIRGVPATAPARTALDVAREHGFAAGLVVADAALRAGVATAADLRRVVQQVSGWRASRQALLVGDHASGARESPAESVSYAGFVIAGLSLPEYNAWVVGHGAGGVRADFVWRENRLVGEVDGRVKYVDPRHSDRGRVLVDEKRRQLRIEEAGFVVVRWTGAEAMYRPDVVLERIVRQSRLAADMYGVPALQVERMARWE